MPVNLFDIPQVINLVLPEGTGTRGVIMMNYSENRSDFTVVKGVSNVIQFFIRDIDRQVVDFTGQTLTINVTDITGTKLVLARVLVPQDLAQGLFSFTTSPSDTKNWISGAMRYGVAVTRKDGTTVMLWTDQNYAPYASLRVVEGPVPVQAPAICLNTKLFLISDGWAYSSPLPGPASQPYPIGNQTFSVFSTGFTGTVRIQGSAEHQPTTDKESWVDVTQQGFNKVTGITDINTIGTDYVWMRVAVSASEIILSPLLPYVYTAGSVDSVLYKSV